MQRAIVFVAALCAVCEALQGAAPRAGAPSMMAKSKARRLPEPAAGPGAAADERPLPLARGTWACAL